MLPTTVAHSTSNVDSPRSPPFLFPGFVVYPGMPSLSFYLHAKQFGLPALPTGIPITSLPWSTLIPSSANGKSQIFELAEKRIGELMVKLRSEETRGETLLQLSKYKDNAHLSAIIWNTFGTRFKVLGKILSTDLIALLIGTMAILINEVVEGYSLLPNITEKDSERICNTLHVLKKAASTVEGRKGFLQGELGAATFFASI